MRLTELDPRWVGAGGPGIRQRTDRPCLACAGRGCDDCHQSGKEYEPAPARHGVGISFRCPCGTHPRDDDFETDRCVILFNNPLDGQGKFDATPDGHYWQREGDTFDTLRLTPSILRTDGCGWHGFIGQTAPGEVTTC